MGALSLYLIIGIITGTFSGLLGIGGGIIIVPGLIWVFQHYAVAPEHYVHLAAGSSLASVSCISLVAANAHRQRKTIVWPLFWHLLPGALVGAVLGALVVKYIPMPLLSISFSLLLIIVAIRMLRTQRNHLLARRKLPKRLGLSSLGLWVGAQSSLLGIGGGITMVPFFARHNIPMLQAAGTSIALSFPLTLAATFTLILNHHDIHIPWCTGYIYWPATLCIAMMSIIFAPLGIRLAHRLPNKHIKHVFAVVLLLTAIDMMAPNLYYYIQQLYS
jgi:uncharacterized protein